MYACLDCLQVREHCQSLLADSLKDNAADCMEGSISESDLENVAAQLEYSIFNSIRVAGSYRLVVSKKVCYCLAATFLCSTAVHQSI